ncbi:hypothetical protein NHX12_006033 [Muraenolepis orangiensis]|uniref:Uncharacterized protein n=1 Tax=Muraenolepis orangiensis TaxID=630683 RepID=A0A9Q0DSG2_9TELE|nr:hypothetical protein NHX12_006033 [Muraenolepis orangiensis]
MPVNDVPAKVEENFLEEVMTDGFIVENPFALTPANGEPASDESDMSEASGTLEGSDDLANPNPGTTTTPNITAMLPGEEEGSSELSGEVSGFGPCGTRVHDNADFYHGNADPLVYGDSKSPDDACQQRWNGPSPAVMAAKSNDRTPKQEMEEFLPKEERREMEYTLVPLSELSEKEPLS